MTWSAVNGATADPSLREAVALVSDAGRFVLYLRQEGGTGLYAKVDA